MFAKLACAAAVVLVVAVAPMQARAQATSAETEADPVVATVNGSSIRHSDVVRAHEGLPEQYKSYPLQLIFSVLVDRLIDTQLITIEAQKGDLRDDDVVKARMAVLEEQVIREVYLERYLADLTTEQALRQRYDQFVEQNPPSEEVRARHILVSSEDEAKAVIERIQAGEDFEATAKELSTGPSAQQGGDIGFFGPGDVVPEFSEAAFALKPGEITEEPVHTQFGWHVIKVEDRRTADPPSFEDTREQLVTEVSREAVGELISKLREDATIERFNPDGSPRAE